MSKLTFMVGEDAFKQAHVSANDMVIMCDWLMEQRSPRSAMQKNFPFTTKGFTAHGTLIIADIDILYYRLLPLITKVITNNPNKCVIITGKFMPEFLTRNTFYKNHRILEC